MPTSLIVSRLAEREGDVAIFDHVLNLSSHYTKSRISSPICEPVRTTPGSVMV